ncbi:hypothetical protein [Mycobacterium branderi]|uniref:Uncharacterized protein n=1 Tax=Mycobacterium branderi TaxID=43348 RepID=A0A7I7W5A5_9MYCO|nr:hypothetical protein [Mycobacterium branderi]MCV7235375.1 hypothetical protein [Mycobacterium branderi]ORA32995.1 hypothetical protein BST20_23815 [Mycobacterium branderi]BBZ10948.1 hypothetical protein MBRA_11430 [Mycobacterium branderi]
MKLKLETQLGRDGHQATEGHESAVEEQASPPDLTVRNLPKSLRILLACWVGVDAAIVLALAVWNATLTTSAWDLIGSALLLGIGITCALAFGQIVRGSGNALMTAMVSQIFIAGLAAYVWLVDQRSPVSQLMGITGVALTLGGIALAWVLYLGRYARTAVTKGAAVVVALFPLIGLVQFWMQTQYLPEASSPLVDVNAELSPMGSTGPIIHLLAKVTLHSRGSVQIDMPAGLMRVTSYPVGTPTEPATTEALLAGLDPSGRSLRDDYREKPTLPGDSTLLYASIIAASYEDSFLNPGETSTYQRVIDVDSRTVRLVRLSVEATLVTHRMMQETRSCYPPQVSFSQDPGAFLSEAGKLHEWGVAGARVLCTESQFASTGAIQDLVSDHPVMRTITVVDNPAHVAEVPTLVPLFGTREAVDDPFTHVATLTQVGNSTPATLFRDWAEYAPSDADLRGGAA